MSTYSPAAGDHGERTETGSLWAGSEADVRDAQRRTSWTDAAIGAVAALAASGLMLWAGRQWGGVIVAQLIAERLTEIMPLSLFRRALDALESNAKPLTLLGITLAQVGVGAAIGAIYGRFALPGARRRFVSGSSLALGVWLLLSLVAAPLGEVGVFAVEVSGDLWRTQLTFVLGAVVFAALVATLIPWPAGRLEASSAPYSPSRRRLAAAGALAAMALVSGGYIGNYVRQLRRRSPAPAVITAASDVDFAFTGMPPRITPTDDFYVVSKNLVDPTVDGASWTLEIGGMVDRPFALSYSDIVTREASEFTSTLECISNELGGKYISTAVWTGFPLRNLLDEAGLQAGVVDIELHAADGYVESIPLAEALAPDTMLVYRMNGAPLTDEHGFPARLIVPGIFGMKNVKWITGIYAVDHDVQGYWQERGWSDVATVVTMSRIDVPKARTRHRAGVPLRLGGVAFAGDRGISRVEVSVDNGASWQVAELDAVISPLAWRLWQYEFTPDSPGERFVLVRATDGTGETQTSDVRPTLPDGATGYHRIKLFVD